MLRLELAVAQLRVIGPPEAHRTKEGPAVTVTNPDTVRTVFIDWPNQSPWIRFLFLFLLHVTNNKLFIFILLYFISSYAPLLSGAVVLPSPERCVRGVSVGGVWWVFGICAARYLNLGVKNGLLGVELIR